uniref:Uncharacterized protein n=1 Tax=Ixodes ricinus TaxID=34613 RepID=A0A6B0UHA1_IXORI
MYCSINISVFVFLPSLKCIPVFVFPYNFCLYLKCISDRHRDTLLQIHFSISILAAILMYPTICISKYIFECFCPTLLDSIVLDPKTKFEVKLNRDIEIKLPLF